MPFLSQAQTFTEILKTVAFDREAEDRFGYAVDISGNYAIIGAYADDFGDLNPNMGSAYIFEKTGIEDWTFVQKIQASDQDDYDRFGWSVAINGNVAVVGAYGEDEDESDENSLAKAGSAYIFERDEAGIWVEVQKIVASDREEDDWFGWSVDISNETIIVGAQQEGHDEFGGDFIFRSGSVYAFDRNVDGIWIESQKIVAWDRQPDFGGGDETMSVGDYMDIDYGDLFGCTIAISGDFMIVGANNNDFNPDGFGGQRQAGAAYIFQRLDGVWVEDQKLCATIRSGWDRYGYAVDIDSNVAVVGAKAEDQSEFEAAFLHNAGSAYIYERDADGNWFTVQKIDASDRGVGDHFGIDVAIAGDVMVIGAESNNFDEDGDFELNNAGAAYVFEKLDDGTWNEIQKIDASDRVLEDWFGNAIAISEHTILIGAWQQDFNETALDSVEDAGAAYFFSSLLCETEFVTQDIDICAGESVYVGESVYTLTGTYTDTLLNSDACDSIVTTNLAVAPLITATEAITLCFGETYTIGASVYDETGFYTDTLTAESGCDSIVNTDLFIHPENLTEELFYICTGESVVVGESVYSEPGVYTDIFVSEALCDSIVISTVEFVTEIDITLTEEDAITITSNEPTGGSTSFQWVNCDTWELIDGATDQSYIATENGNYAVIISKDFCIDTSACVTISSVGLNDETMDFVGIYPNPNSGVFTLEFNPYQVEESAIRVLNSSGSLVYSSKLTQTKTNVDLGELASGLYIVEITSGTAVIIRKVQIQ